jgi:hypothetical protein
LTIDELRLLIVDLKAHQPPSAVNRPSSFVLRPSTFDLRPSTFDLRPSTFDLQTLLPHLTPLATSGRTEPDPRYPSSTGGSSLQIKNQKSIILNRQST